MRTAKLRNSSSACSWRGGGEFRKSRLVQEAAFLLNCSDGHLRNLIKKAKHKKTSHPIPFNDLDGLFTFNREELIVWSRNPKERLKKA
jgi:hypothetical protein